MLANWTQPDVINAVAAIVALGFGVAAFIRDNAQNKRLIELQENADRRDAGRREDEVRAARGAKLIARLQRRPKAHPELLVSNVGAGRADHVRIYLDGIAAHASELVLKEPSDKRTESFGPLDAQGSCALQLLFTAFTPREFRVRVEWTDATGEDRWESSIAR